MPAGIRRSLDRNWATSAQRGRLPVGSSSTQRDANRSGTSLLLLMDGGNGATTFTDKSPNNFTVTVNGNAQVAAASLKTLGNSAAFDGSGDSLSIADNAALRINTGDFTVECWIKTTQSRQYATLISKGNNNFTSGSWTLLVNEASASAGDVGVYSHAANSAAGVWLRSTGVNVRDGNEHHIAWVRYGNLHYLFVDGAQVASASGGYSSASEVTNPVIIGNDANFTPRDFSGNIGGVRITKGFARYVRPFTVPDRQFVAG